MLCHSFTLRIAQARLAPEHWGPIVQALAWELLKVGDNAPRIVRAALRRLEADPVVPDPAANTAAILSAGR
jgi:ubiquinone biosynthesis protein